MNRSSAKDLCVLLEFGIKNFFSFKEGCSISFRLPANCPPSIAQGRNFTPVLCIKGANASGKTQILKGLAFLGKFVSQSFLSDPDGPIAVEPFFYNTEPCSFYAEFMVGKNKYLYELEVTDKEVHRETLYRTKSKKIKILERINNRITERIQSLAKVDSMSMRTNASIISTARQYQLDLPELNEVFHFFASILANVRYEGLRETTTDLKQVAKFLSDKEDLFGFVKSFISECDVGVSDIQFHVTEDAEGKKEHIPFFLHSVNGKDMPVHAVGESSGTKALFKTLPVYRLVLDAGGVAVLDEFDINLHPHILPKLLALFIDPATNPNNAQLIFTTHNSEIMDSMGRYRTYLVNKEENESFAYRLDEIPGDMLRNDRPILPVYNDGKIGGVPKV